MHHAIDYILKTVSFQNLNSSSVSDFTMCMSEFEHQFLSRTNKISVKLLEQISFTLFNIR
jgi:hypothetical protein